VSDIGPFLAPGGTLFIFSNDASVLLTTLEGGEARLPLSDLHALFDYLAELDAPPHPKLRPTSPSEPDL
jgi:hypothetical protein